MLSRIASWRECIKLLTPLFWFSEYGGTQKEKAFCNYLELLRYIIPIAVICFGMSVILLKLNILR